VTREQSRGSAARRLAERKARPGALRVPGWVLPVLAAGSGWVFAGWPGAVFGAVVGALVWRTR
jgi:hypothetical protein